MPHHTYDSIAHKSETRGVYCDHWIEHSHSDVEYVIKLEEEEQARRLVDKDGEKQRQHTALRASEIITESVRPVWFGRGSTFVINLLKAMRKGGNDLLRSSQIRAVVDKFNEITQKTQASVDSYNETIHNTLIDTKLKAQETSHNAKLKLRETSENAKLKFRESSQNAKLKLEETSQSAKHKLEETSHNAKLKFEESSREIRTKVEGKLDATHEKVLTATDFANEKILKIGGAVQGIVDTIASTGASFIEKLREKWGNLTTNTNLAFALIEEENERAFRLSSDFETFAILNALLLSSLIKDLKPEFYRPDFEPTRKYSTHLLEEIERKRRMVEDLFDKKAIENAKTISFLINEKFCATAVEIPPLPAKIEIIEPIHVTPSPMGAAM